ncbi:MAG: hypothetical protein WBP45_14925 [Daejeonella sp.]
MKIMETERTAYVFVDELEEGKSQIIFSNKKYSNPNFEVIEVKQKKYQQKTETALLKEVKLKFEKAEIEYSTKNGYAQTFILTNKN